MSSYTTRGPATLGEIRTRESTNVTYELTLSRKDKKPVNLSADEAVKIMRRLVGTRERQLAAESSKRARESVQKEIEFLRTERPELYAQFTNGARLSDLLEVVASEKRLVKAIRSGTLR